jgi:predicted small metal-binding protein
MRGAGRECFPPTIHRGDLNNCRDDKDIGQDCEGKGAHDNAAADSKASLLIVVVISARKSHDRRDVTEEMLNNTGSTEGKGEGVEGVEG